MTSSAPGGHRLTDVFRAALRDTLVLVGGLAVVGAVVGGLLAGVPGVWGALIGAGAAAFFSGTTLVSMLVTADAPAGRTTAVIMGAWLGKVAVLGIVLAVLSTADFYSRAALGVVLIVGVTGSAALDYRAVTRHPTAYVVPRDRDGAG